MDNYNLVAIAKEAMAMAYAPYSNFKVGAALLCKDGTVYSGCNIENASYGATICAERTAIAKAVSEGKSMFEAIAIVCSNNTEATPCGICRQVMAEFFQNDTRIVLENNSEIIEYTFDEVMPFVFKLDNR